LNNGDDPGLQDYWRVIWRRKWIVILTVVVITGSAVVFSFIQTPIYEASATLHLKEAKEGPGQIDMFGGTSFLPTDTEINTQVEILKSRTVMEEVARRLFSSRATQEEKAGKTAESPGQDEPEPLSQIAERLRKKNMSVTHIRETRLITVTASYHDPEMAQLISNNITEVFIERDISSRRRETTVALNFLSREAGKTEENLRQAEENLKRYKEKEGFAELSGRGKLMVERLSKLESEHESTRISRQELDNRLSEIRNQLKKVSKVWVSSTYISDNPLVQMLRSRLTDLEIKYAQLSREFSSDDPQVTHVRAQIEETKKELKSKVKTVVAGKTETISPIYTELYTKLVSYEGEVNALSAKEDALRTLVAKYEDEVNRLPQQELTLARLEREKQVNAELYAILVKARNEAEIASASAIGTIEVVDPAPRPTRPVRPKKEQNALIGSISGLMLGILFCFLLERSDKTIKTEDEVKKLLNLPILGVIPRVDAQGPSGGRYLYRPSERKKRKETKASSLEESRTPVELITRDLPKSPTSEAYRVLTTNLQFAELERKLKTLVVASSIPLEGKTSVAINLAITLTSARSRVLLVDADLRFPTIHRTFKLDTVPGLTDLLIGLESPEWVIHSVEGVENLDILTSGSSPPNPSELLRSSRMKELISEIQKEYDKVLFDCPPVLGLADAPILSTNVDGVLLVAGASEVDRQAVQKAKESLEKVRAHILGVILNKVEPEHSGYGRYYYYRSGDEKETQQDEGSLSMS
jgi:tyrosine-protein kinase Etk/Wzc